MTTSRRTVLITGCSSGGIGSALAQEFHRRGLRVIATARRLESMADLAAQGIETLELDVTNNDSVQKAREAVAELTGGKLDILVNNAGQSYVTSAIDYDVERAKTLFDANLFGVMRMVKSFVDLLIASGDGRILQIGSIAAVTPVPFGSIYNASKAALHAYSNTLRVELAPFNVKVITVVTGGVDTNIGRPSSIPLNSLYRPIEDIYQARRVNLVGGTMDPSQYAKTVVAEAISTRPRATLWAGKHSLTDYIMARRFGLSSLAVMFRRKLKTA